MPVSKFYDENTVMQKLLQAGASPAMSDDVPEPVLKELCPDGKMTASACERIMQFCKKEKQVKEKVNLSKIKVRPDDGRIYILINRKMISSNSYTGLIEKLYEMFFGVQTSTLESFFEEWMLWRKNESAASEKTMKENRILWNAMLRGNELTQIPMKELRVQDFISFFRSITKDRTVTRKRFNDMKSILNGMLYLAVEREIIPRNYLKDINYQQFPYKAANTKICPYTEIERRQMIQYFQKQESDLYNLAILLDFHLVLRIGELKALRWSDIHGDYIKIQHFVNDDNQLIEDVKGHAEEGVRLMPLTPTAKRILEQVKQLNEGNEYLFFRGKQPLSTSTFNRRLRKCCEALKIEYRSSHKLRFSTASIMYRNGLRDTELQMLLGHTSLSMTRHYLRNLASEEQTASKMAEILG